MFRIKMYEQWTQPVYRRIYSEKRIIEKLGKIPENAVHITIPGLERVIASLFESVFGKFFVVSQMNKYEIEGNTGGQFVLAALEESKRAKLRANWGIASAA